MTTGSDKLDSIADDVSELKGWTARHEERHGDDADMLSLVLKDLDLHKTNHHGRASTIKQSGWIAAALTLLYGIAAAIRQILL